MKVVLLGSKNGRKKLPEVYNTLIEILTLEKVEILGPYTQKYEEVLTKDELLIKNKLHMHSIFMKKIIDQSDLMIVETTFDGFALGHEATLALAKYKPVLAISQNNKDFSFINSKRFIYKNYEKVSDLESIIKDFFSIYRRKFKTSRVNILLHQEQLNFLKEIHDKKHLNRSSYIRTVLDKAMEEEGFHKMF